DGYVVPHSWQVHVSCRVRWSVTSHLTVVFRLGVTDILARGLVVHHSRVDGGGDLGLLLIGGQVVVHNVDHPLRVTFQVGDTGGRGDHGEEVHGGGPVARPRGDTLLKLGQDGDHEGGDDSGESARFDLGAYRVMHGIGPYCRASMDR